MYGMITTTRCYFHLILLHYLFKFQIHVTANNSSRANDFSADVYSFALLMWELITRETPFEPLGQIEAAASSAIEHNRPPFPPGISLALKAVIERCWVDRPDDRMTVPSIIEWLENATNHLAKESIVWLDHPYGHPVYKTQKGVHASAKETRKKTTLLRNALFGKKKRNDTFDRMG
jgi:hypothetical protein